MPNSSFFRRNPGPERWGHLSKGTQLAGIPFLIQIHTLNGAAEAEASQAQFDDWPLESREWVMENTPQIPKVNFCRWSTFLIPWSGRVCQCAPWLMLAQPRLPVFRAARQICWYNLALIHFRPILERGGHVMSHCNINSISLPSLLLLISRGHSMG